MSTRKSADNPLSVDRPQDFDLDSVVTTGPPPEEGGDLATFQQIARASGSAEGTLVSGAALGGDAYTRLDGTDRKRQLVGVPFVIEDFDIRDGVAGEYSIVRVVTIDNERYSFTDGGTGITPALLKLNEGTRVLCRSGLRASDYEYQGKPATTFYLT